MTFTKQEIEDIGFEREIAEGIETIQKNIDTELLNSREILEEMKPKIEGMFKKFKEEGKIINYSLKDIKEFRIGFVELSTTYSIRSGIYKDTIISIGGRMIPIDVDKLLERIDERHQDQTKDDISLI